MRARRHVVAQMLTGRHPQLLLDEIEPVTISVTGCSTCSRVFISMKKYSSGRAEATMNSTVPTPV